MPVGALCSLASVSTPSALAGGTLRTAHSALTSITTMCASSGRFVAIRRRVAVPAGASLATRRVARASGVSAPAGSASPSLWRRTARCLAAGPSDATVAAVALGRIASASGTSGTSRASLAARLSWTARPTLAARSAATAVAGRSARPSVAARSVR
jgi:hypothetical protein